MKLRSGETERDVEAPQALPRGVRAVRDGKHVFVHFAGETYRVEQVVNRGGGHEAEHSLLAPMPGRVTKVFVAEGDAVTKGTPLLVLEAMKMEHQIKAPRDGKVGKLHHGVGDMVGLGDALAEID